MHLHATENVLLVKGCEAGVHLVHIRHVCLEASEIGRLLVERAQLSFPLDDVHAVHHLMQKNLGVAPARLDVGLLAPRALCLAVHVLLAIVEEQQFAHVAVNREELHLA